MQLTLYEVGQNSEDAKRNARAWHLAYRSGIIDDKTYRHAAMTFKKHGFQNEWTYTAWRAKSKKS